LKPSSPAQSGPLKRYQTVCLGTSQASDKTLEARERLDSLRKQQQSFKQLVEAQQHEQEAG